MLQHRSVENVCIGNKNEWFGAECFFHVVFLTSCSTHPVFFLRSTVSNSKNNVTAAHRSIIKMTAMINTTMLKCKKKFVRNIFSRNFSPIPNCLRCNCPIRISGDRFWCSVSSYFSIYVQLSNSKRKYWQIHTYAFVYWLMSLAAKHSASPHHRRSSLKKLKFKSTNCWKKRHPVEKSSPKRWGICCSGKNCGTIGRTTAAKVRKTKFILELWSHVHVTWFLIAEFKRPDLSTDESVKPPAKKFKRNLGDAIADACKQNKFYMGNAELTRLWNLCPDNLQACRGADRNFLPSIEQYLENPKDKTDATFEWRALRLLARQSPHFFTMIQTPNKVSDYLESVRKKISESQTKTKVESIEVKPDVDEEVQIQNSNEDGLTRWQDDSEMLKSSEQDDKNTHKTAIATPEQLKELSVIIGGTWQKLGSKLGELLSWCARLFHQKIWHSFTLCLCSLHSRSVEIFRWLEPKRTRTMPYDATALV